MDTNDSRYKRKHDDTSTPPTIYESTEDIDETSAIAASRKAKAERKYLNQLKKESNRSFSHPNRHEHKR